MKTKPKEFSMNDNKNYVHLEFADEQEAELFAKMLQQLAWCYSQRDPSQTWTPQQSIFALCCETLTAIQELVDENTQYQPKIRAPKVVCATKNILLN